MTRFHGSTFVSVMLATVIMGCTGPAVVELGTVCSLSSVGGAELTQAISLANDVHEFALTLPIANAQGKFGLQAGETPPNCGNLYGLQGWTFDPPIDSSGRPIDTATGWQQRCTLSSFETTQPATSVNPTNTNARLLTVAITRNAKVVYSVSRVLAPTVGK